jgi:tetratricopeptide (TPR) repeat protein
VALVAFAAYARTLPFPLLWDDQGIAAYVADVARERGLAGLARAEFLLDARGANHLGYYRPVVLLSFAADAALARVIPVAHHLTNCLLHAANAALVLLLARAAIGAGWGALFAGLLFALHPVHVESVAFVSGRTDLWAALFCLMAALAWVRGRAAAGAPAGLLAAGAASLLLAALSKEVALMLPLVLLAWDALLPAEGPVGLRGWLARNRGWVAAWSLALAAAAAIRLGAAGIGFGPGAGQTWAAGARAEPLLFPKVWLAYLRLLAFPWPLSAQYTPADLGVTATGLAAAAATVGLCAATAGRGARRAGLVGAAWIAGFLLPVSGVRALAGAIVAERFLYLPSVGICLAAGAALDLAWARRGARGAVVAAGGAVLAGALLGTLAGSAVWRDSLTLFRETARRSPQSAVAWFNLGNALGEAGRGEEALGAYAAAARIAPGFGDAHLARGTALMRLGRPAEAVASFTAAAGSEPRSAAARYNLAVAWLALDRPEAAARESLAALELQPGDPLAANNLGVAYSRLGRHAEAAGAFRRALAADPGCAGCAFNLGLECEALGRPEEAAAAYAAALRLDPGNAGARLGLDRARAAPPQP